MARHHASVTSVSWIPSEGIRGLPKLPFTAGVGSYDRPPPAHLGDVDALYASGGFRFANRLEASVDVEDGRIVGYTQDGRTWVNTTMLTIGGTKLAFFPRSLPDIVPPPVIGDDHVTFRRTAGGRTGVPAPRHVLGPPFVQWSAPTVWTTLEVTLYADGTSSASLVGASEFPRHWVYDDEGRLTAKSGLMRFTRWYRRSYGSHSPWGGTDNVPLVCGIESEVERSLSSSVMRGRPRVRTARPGTTIVRQGDRGDDVLLVLDGLVDVDVDGRTVARVGPGAVLGERASLADGRRTATLRAATPCSVASIPAEAIDRGARAELAATTSRRA